MKKSEGNPEKRPVGRPKKKLTDNSVKIPGEKPIGPAKPVKKPARKAEEKSEKKSMRNSGHISCWKIAVENYAEVIKQAAKERELRARVFKAIDNDVNKLSGFLQTKDGQALLNESVECAGRLQSLSNIAIVFSLMTLESYITSYAVMKLHSKAYYVDYLDHLKLSAKWVIIPRLAVNKQISTSSRGFIYFRNLLSYRNEIIHEKPVDMDSESYIKKVLSKTAPNPETQPRTAIEAVKEMLKELKKVDHDVDIDWIKIVEKQHLSPI